MSAKLTPRMAIFYGEIIKDGNATRSAIVAGCPEASAHVTGARWKKNKAVAAAIAEWESRQIVRAERTAAALIQKLEDVVYHDAKNLYDSAGKQIPVEKLDDVTRAAIASVDNETILSDDGSSVRRQRVKFADRLRAIELLGRYHKLFTDKMEVEGRLTLEQLVCGKSEAA